MTRQTEQNKSNLLAHRHNQTQQIAAEMEPTLLKIPQPGNQAAQQFALHCPLHLPTPAACPFGGACHACPARAQAKLKVSQPGDALEQEADHMAEQVLRKAAPCAICGDEEELHAKALGAPTEQREASPEEEDEPVQAKTKVGEVFQEVSGLDEQVTSLQGSGQPLPEAERRFFEPHFGTDFSQVRIHVDPASADRARARAFTFNNHIVFGSGEYDPGSRQGRYLLAHELAHVVQQKGQAPGATKLQRLVRANYVSCNNPTPAIAAITGATPVTTISNANSRAITLLDNVIDELESTRNDIIGGSPVAWPTISDALAQALRDRFHLDPDAQNVWTGTGEGTVAVVIRRFRAVRDILDGGWIRYTCLAGTTINTATCAGSACDGTTWAVSCEGLYRIFLCQPFWGGSLDDQATTLLHECFHIYYGHVGDTGNIANAHCYEQFLADLNNITIPAAFVGMCP